MCLFRSSLCGEGRGQTHTLSYIFLALVSGSSGVGTISYDVLSSVGQRQGRGVAPTALGCPGVGGKAETYTSETSRAVKEKSYRGIC